MVAAVGKASGGRSGTGAMDRAVRLSGRSAAGKSRVDFVRVDGAALAAFLGGPRRLSAKSQSRRNSTLAGRMPPAAT
jgi:hypothetical protein